MEPSEIKIYCIVKEGSDGQFESLLLKRQISMVPYQITIVEINMDNSLDFYLNALSTEEYNFVFLPLSMYGYTSLKIAEFIHLTNSQTRLILYSRTLAPAKVLLNIFDAFYTYFPDFSKVVPAFMDRPIKRVNNRETLESYIAAILATASCFDHGFGHDTSKSKLDDYRSGARMWYSPPVKRVKTSEQIEPVREPLTVFFSYAHADEFYKVQLEQHLALLKRQGHIKTWHDRKITAGDEWKGAINKNLSEADIILLLISSAFMASDYCYDIEMQVAMEKQKSGKADVIPIIIRPTDWLEAPFAKLQALPEDAKPVSVWVNADEAWLNVASRIRALIRKTRGFKQ